MRIPRTFLSLSLSVPTVCLALIIMASGCSAPLPKERALSPRTWSCDSDADEALKGHGYEKAIRLHEGFLAGHPDNGLALYHLGYAYGQVGDHLKEVLYYEKATSLGYKTANIYFNMGMAYGELDNKERAIAAFSNSLEMDPGNIDAMIYLGMLYWEIGKKQEARNQLRKVLDIDPNNSMAQKLLKDINRK